jgi:hypothetical protein
MHKTPHLLGTDIMYSLDVSQPPPWHELGGSLAASIHDMARDFLSRLTNTPDIPEASMSSPSSSLLAVGLG